MRYAAGLPPGRDARPHVRAVHGKHPQRVRIARMQRPSESRSSPTDFGIAAPMSRQRVAGPVEPVNAAVVLLIEPIGIAADASARSADRGRTPGRDPAGSRRARPGSAASSRAPRVGRLEHAAARHADVHMLRIARIDRGSSAASGRPACRPGRRRTTPCAAGCALNPSTPSHVAPPSVERNSPCGDVPAYQTPGSRAWPGVSQNV